jgi:hypothetical protein
MSGDDIIYPLVVDTQVISPPKYMLWITFTSMPHGYSLFVPMVVGLLFP